jgi:hypothetical protein
MPTICVAIISLGLLGCAGADRAESGDPMKQLSGGYRLIDSEILSAETAPELVRNMGLRSVRRLHYQGPEEFQVTIFEMNSGSSAFELVQKWKAEPGKLHFHQASRFILLESTGADHATLNRLAGTVEKEMEK